MECSCGEGACAPSFQCVVNDEVRMSFWILLILLSSVVVILGIVDLATGKITFQGITDHKHWAAIVVAICFCLAATVITGLQALAHYRHWTYPPAQIKIVRIIFMVPIYAWSAFCGLFFVRLAAYIDFIRVCYEAFVIYNFLLLLTKYLGGKEGVVKMLRRQPKQAVPWPSPFCCFQATLNAEFLVHIKRGTLQYVIISPLCSFAAVVMGAFDCYGDGVIDWRQGYVYIAIIQNITQVVALYCLIWFYLISKDELAPFKPLYKFIVVKAVVFFTFWQGVFINILVRIGVIQDSDDFTAAEIQLGLQDFVICVEMFIAAAVHRYTFGHESYADGTFQKMLDEIISRDAGGNQLPAEEVRANYEANLTDLDPEPFFISSQEAAKIDRDLSLQAVPEIEAVSHQRVNSGEESAYRALDNSL